MLHLDTNALIALPEWMQQPAHPILVRILGGEPVAVCALVWYEYVAGPIDDDEIRHMDAFLQSNVVAVHREDAELAATLFNRAGRARRFKTDALIAACAIRADAEFVTLNGPDFVPFQKSGLRLLAAEL